MTSENFARAVVHAAEFYNAETQFELNLAGIGESTLHAHFPEFIKFARSLMPAIRIVFATNGLTFALLNDLSEVKESQKDERERARSIINALVEAKKTGEVHVWVSMHRPEKAGLAVDVLRDAGLLAGVSGDPTLNADDWAGQVKWKRSHQQKMTCQFLRDGKVMVMADGRVTTCCLDASGVGVIGHVNDPPEEWKPHVAFSLCKTCQYLVPETMK